MGSLGTLESLADIPLHTALEKTGTGLVACDAAGRLTLLSPALQEIFGLTFAPHDEQRLPELFRLYRADGETMLAPEETPLARARAGEFVRDVVVAARSCSGELVHLKCNAVPLTDGSGAIVGAIALVQDVTVERAARQVAEDLRSRLVHTVNHEFRTPLSTMLGHLELLQEHRDELSPEVVRSLKAIERAGWRMRDIVCAAADLVEQQEDRLAARVNGSAARESRAS